MEKNLSEGEVLGIMFLLFVSPSLSFFIVSPFFPPLAGDTASLTTTPPLTCEAMQGGKRKHGQEGKEANADHGKEANADHGLVRTDEKDEKEHPPKRPYVSLAEWYRRPDLNELHRHPRDERIRFDEGPHLYYVADAAVPTARVPTLQEGGGGGGGGNNPPSERTVSLSVTGFVHALFPTFDEQVQALAKCRKSAFPFGSRDTAYWGLPLFRDGRSLEEMRQLPRQDLGPAGLASARLPAEEMAKVVMQHWRENAANAASLGTALHADCEAYYLGGTPQNTSAEYRHFLAYAERVAAEGWVPFRTEARLFAEEYDLAGSVDMVYARVVDLALRPHLRPSPLPVRLVDWKRCKEIRFVGFGGEMGFLEASGLPNCNAAAYCLQLATYGHLLRKHYGMRPIMREFVVLHPSASGPQVHDLDAVARTLLGADRGGGDIDAIVEAALERRRVEVLRRSSKEGATVGERGEKETV